MKSTGTPHQIALALADPVTADAAHVRLERTGHVVTTVGSVAALIAHLDTGVADLVVVDCALDGVGDVSTARSYADRGSMPGLVVDTAIVDDACNDLPDTVLGRPFSLTELVDRVNDVLRPTVVGISEPDQTIRCAGLVIDPASTTVTLDGVPVPVDDKSFGVLHMLAMTPRRIYSRQDLQWAVWGASPEWQRTKVVTAQVYRLWAALGEDPAAPRWVVPAWGLGYWFNPTGVFRATPADAT